jgi:membrane dipeptidase
MSFKICSIGFGSDFDGIDGLPKGITGPQGFPYIIERLFKANYKEDDVLKICSGNYQRVLEKTL